MSEFFREKKIQRTTEFRVIPISNLIFENYVWKKYFIFCRMVSIRNGQCLFLFKWPVFEYWVLVLRPFYYSVVSQYLSKTTRHSILKYLLIDINLEICSVGLILIKVTSLI